MAIYLHWCCKFSLKFSWNCIKSQNSCRKKLHLRPIIYIQTGIKVLTVALDRIKSITIMPLNPQSTDINYIFSQAQELVKWFTTSGRSTPEAYAPIATSVTSIKGKDHKIAEEHTEHWACSWGWWAKFMWWFWHYKGLLKIKGKRNHQKQKGIPAPKPLLCRLAQLESLKVWEKTTLHKGLGTFNSSFHPQIKDYKTNSKVGEVWGGKGVDDEKTNLATIHC